MGHRRVRAIVGTLVFFIVAPGTIAGWIPYRVTAWQIQPPLFGVTALRPFGIVLAVAGLVLLIDCFARFALEGRGTPAPVAPTETLVASGPYQFVRNPIYIAVLLIVIGQALFFGSFTLLAYAGVLWLAFHAFVVAYEEPTLRRRYGPSYDAYHAHVRRWWPRIRPWLGSEAA